MFDFQEALDGILAAGNAQRAAERNQMPLGELALLLSTFDPEAVVMAEVGEVLHGVSGVDSYRGYYSDLAIEFGGSTTVSELLGDLRGAIGHTFTGYKGGDFTMARATSVWVSSYGSADGNAVIGLRQADDGNVVIIETVKEEW